MAILNYHPSIKFIGFTIVAFVFLTATFKLKLITSSMASLSGLAASNEATAASHLVFELAQTTHSPPAISVKVRNTHKTKTFTFLIWDTPLDPQALALGVFHVVDSATGQELPSLGLMLNRVLPPAREDLREVKPNQAIDHYIVLKPPHVQLKSEQKYKIKAAGTIKAVWEKKKEDVSDAELEDLGGGDAVAVVDFSTEEIEIEVA